MTNTANSVLCGGTFLTQILQSRKPTASHRQRTQGLTDVFQESDVLFELVKIVNPDYVRPAGSTFRTHTTNYKKCAKYTPNDLKFENDAVMSAFLARLETDYITELNKMTEFVNRYIDVGTTAQNDVLLVKRLIELIRDDNSIPATTQFAVCKDGLVVDKSGLETVDVVYLPAFLLSIWTFIVIERKDNSLGAETFSAWQDPKAQGRYAGINGSTVLQELTVECDEYIAPVHLTSEEEDVEAKVPTAVGKFIMPDVYKYLRKAEEKYSTIKILIDRDNPKPFYDFYVCNGINNRTVNKREPQRSQSGFPIENATVDRIAQHTKFAIICGTGGLGKSMMMQHLMLNTIANFDDLKLFPIFIPLKNFDETAGSLFEYTYSKISALDSSLTERIFEQLLDNGSCILLYDGIDEIGAYYMKKFERELEDLTDKYSKNMFILSSRPFQSFISFSRFNVFHLMPFTPRQALQLINKLEFRPDEPAIKKKFMEILDKTLVRTHQSFTENPLLLTIMLLTFEQYAEVPSKMYVFYRAAFEVLAREHDKTKGAYKRPLNTGLAIDDFIIYFAELCFRSYNDEKFELTAEEFTGYYNILNARIVANDNKTTARDFIDDLCSNLCLMYFEGGCYHFTHGSFQEYFCALFLSKQKDKVTSKLGDFFEQPNRRMYCNDTFNMLYDMITEKVEEFIFLPHLTALLDKCKEHDGYWTFLEEMYPQITYGYENGFQTRHLQFLKPLSFIFSKILEKSGFKVDDKFKIDLPYYESFEVEQLTRIRQERIFGQNGEEIDVEEMEEAVGYVCQFDVTEVYRNPDAYSELVDKLNDDNFVLKKQYQVAQQYLEELADRQKTENDSLLDLL